MHEPLDLPAWLPPLRSALRRLGPRPAHWLFCAFITLVCVALSQLVVSLLGRGDRPTAALVAALCGLSLAAVFSACVLALLAHLDRALRFTARYATRDSLTGLCNRRQFLSLVEREWSLARRYQTPCALVLIDIDHFKRINEAFGHACGDMLLRQVAEVSGETLRQADVLCRYGGEEFMLFLPHTDPLGALDVAERIRERVLAMDFAWNAHPVPVSVSIGVAVLKSGHVGLDDLLNEADEALHLAKAEGRNCVRAGPGLLPGTFSALQA
ncbi:GGDEF domain-containing protein [Paucibacter sp. DJ1R-11]|uniref:GGDEF domain-containing protein n=1 Tax=Paucibacter sp. DJ1R-11 TaxID=2893556 RepID=UPI0021E399F8|nr:GGDEF domain-containing protein [Paucibacter sp. DJ1R-11]MCV2364357.1 GGDEF domain-containing protein [Paucibacter sp. DJ1R-11]